MVGVQCCGDPGWTVGVQVQAWGIITQFVLILATFAGIWMGLRGVKNQLWLQTFTEYTGRYADAMAHLPFDARRVGAPKDLDALSSEDRNNLLTGMRRYFNLCSEEWYLQREKKIDQKTWGIWLQGIREATNEPFFASSWEFLRPEYAGFEAFCRFIDDIIASSRVSRP